MFKFEDLDVNGLDLSNTLDFCNLFVHYLCGQKKFRYKNMNDFQHKILMETIRDLKNNEKLNFEQFNEILLLFNQDRVSMGFFYFLFSENMNYHDYTKIKKHKIANKIAEIKLDFEKLKRGITIFRGYCLIHYGNFNFTYEFLSKFSLEEILKTFEEYLEDQKDIEMKFQNRSDPIINLEDIPKKNRWYLGYITKQRLTKELDALKNTLSESLKLKEKYESFYEDISQKDKESKITYKKGEKNTNIYLVWDYIDIYIATSMRCKSDFVELAELLDKLFEPTKWEKINPKKIRVFDPTIYHT